MVFTRIKSTLIRLSRIIDYFNAAEIGLSGKMYGSTDITLMKQNSSANAYSIKPQIMLKGNGLTPLSLRESKIKPKNNVVIE